MARSKVLSEELRGDCGTSGSASTGDVGKIPSEYTMFEGFSKGFKTGVARTSDGPVVVNAFQRRVHTNSSRMKAHLGSVHPAHLHLW